MDRTAQGLRRTILCAVFACPLAVWRLLPALTAQALFWLYPLDAQAALWHTKRKRDLGTPILPFAVSWALYWIGKAQFPASLLPAYRCFCLLSGLSLQCRLLTQPPGRRRVAACLAMIVLFWR